jgi:hypothetical protein
MHILQQSLCILIVGGLLTSCASTDVWRGKEERKTSKRIVHLVDKEVKANNSDDGLLIIIAPDRTIKLRSSGRSLEEAGANIKPQDCESGDVIAFVPPKGMPVRGSISDCTSVISSLEVARRLKTLEAEMEKLDIAIKEIKVTVYRTVQLGLYLDTLYAQQSKAFHRFDKEIQSQTQELSKSNTFLTETRQSLEASLAQISAKLNELNEQLKRF